TQFRELLVSKAVVRHGEDSTDTVDVSQNAHQRKTQMRAVYIARSPGSAISLKLIIGLLSVPRLTSHVPLAWCIRLDVSSVI
ncbi:hypothetical protein, partial [Allochromatium vinosum]|uniref:hypothetical protein n=1 Tax=Allochromatium vinosum TaxID=1049 RepID=UPI001A90D87B